MLPFLTIMSPSHTPRLELLFVFLYLGSYFTKVINCSKVFLGLIKKTKEIDSMTYLNVWSYASYSALLSYNLEDVILILMWYQVFTIRKKQLNIRWYVVFLWKRSPHVLMFEIDPCYSCSLYQHFCKCLCDAKSKLDSFL